MNSAARYSTMTNKMDTDEGGSSDQGVTESPELTSSTVVVVVPKLDEAGEQPKQMEGPKEEASQILAVKQPYGKRSKISAF